MTKIAIQIVPHLHQTQTKATKKFIMLTDLRIYQLSCENRLEMLLECLGTSILILEEMVEDITMILKKTLIQTIMTNMSLTLITKEKRRNM